MVCSTTHGSRADGISCNSSKVTCVSVLWRRGSMIGAVPETMTVSSTPPTSSVATSGVADAARTCTAVSTNVRKPSRVTLTS